MTYDIWRKIHLFTGFILLAFVFMYFITGYPIIHHSWFPESKNEKTKWTAPVESADIAADPYAYSDYLQEEFGLVGKVQPPANWEDGRWAFGYNSPRVWQRAIVDTRVDSVAIEVTERDLAGVLIAFHRMHGYFGGWFYVLWAFLYDVASFSMIIFAVTGVYMWYKLSRGWERTLGWILGAGSLAFTTWVVLYLTYAA